MTDTITCPNCGHAIEVHAAAAAQIAEHIRREVESELRRKEDDYIRRDKELETARGGIDDEIAARVQAQLSQLRSQVEQSARSAIGAEIEGLQTQLTTAQAKLQQTQAAELELRKARARLEEQKRELELTVTRTLDAERDKIRQDAQKQAAELNRLRDADKDRVIGDLRKQIEDLNRMSESAAQRTQGETLELELENSLRRFFPNDTIEAIPAAHNGGDVLQRVVDNNGTPCGTILWESKRTKNWNDAWLPKLREDQRRAKSDFAVILSVEMPKNVATFGCVDGVWVTNRACFLGLAAALRAGLIAAAHARETTQGKINKVDLLFTYFAGAEFRQIVEGIVEAFVALKQDLDSEKRSLTRIWNKREKQIERAIVNTTALYGDLSAIVGPSLPSIPQLELRSIVAANRPAEEPSDEVAVAESIPF